MRGPGSLYSFQAVPVNPDVYVGGSPGVCLASGIGLSSPGSLSNPSLDLLCVHAVVLVNNKRTGREGVRITFTFSSCVGLSRWDEGRVGVLITNTLYKPRGFPPSLLPQQQP